MGQLRKLCRVWPVLGNVEGRSASYRRAGRDKWFREAKLRRQSRVEEDPAGGEEWGVLGFLRRSPG